MPGSCAFLEQIHLFFWRVQEEFLATPPRGQVLTTFLDQLP